MLEFALEKLDKFCESNSIEKLIVKDKKKGLYHSADFPSHRQNMLNLVNAMEKQFSNANKEFKDKVFLDKIAIIQHKDDIGSMIDKRAKMNSKVDNTKKDSKPLTASWLCTVCTYYNENSNKSECTMCGRPGRPKK